MTRYAPDMISKLRIRVKFVRFWSYSPETQDLTPTKPLDTDVISEIWLYFTMQKIFPQKILFCCFHLLKNVGHIQPPPLPAKKVKSLDLLEISERFFHIRIRNSKSIFLYKSNTKSTGDFLMSNINISNSSFSLNLSFYFDEIETFICQVCFRTTIFKILSIFPSLT